MQDEIVESLSEDKIRLVDTMLHPLLKGLVSNGEGERAIFLFRDLRSRGVKVMAKSYIMMISVCIEINEPEEAFNLLVELKETGQLVPKTHWWYVLECCAANGYVNSLSERLLISARRNFTLLA